MSETPAPVRFSKVAALYLVLVHALALSAFWLPWPRHALPIAVAVYLAVGFGTTVGLHRLLSHHSFRCPRWVEYALVTAAMLTGQGSPLLWVATHRIHHAHTDSPRDVHSPRRGFWYAHLGWILDEGSTEPEAWRTWCRDLAGDAYYHWLIRFRLVPQAIAVVLFGLAFGWSALPACFFLPVVLWMHSTYSVNSVCHFPLFGFRGHETRDTSRNVWWVGVLALGEGWHNNHHAAPRSARYGQRGWQVDVSWWFIRLLQRLGLAREVFVTQPRPVEPETPEAVR
jgi:stearoyl-CoA desaturase (delta-9 desaturase)